jgi:hypothetical protein
MPSSTVPFLFVRKTSILSFLFFFPIMEIYRSHYGKECSDNEDTKKSTMILLAITINLTPLDFQGLTPPCWNLHLSLWEPRKLHVQESFDPSATSPFQPPLRRNRPNVTTTRISATAFTRSKKHFILHNSPTNPNRVHTISRSMNKYKRRSDPQSMNKESTRALRKFLTALNVWDFRKKFGLAYKSCLFLKC